MRSPRMSFGTDVFLNLFSDAGIILYYAYIRKYVCVCIIVYINCNDIYYIICCTFKTFTLKMGVKSLKENYTNGFGHAILLFSSFSRVTQS